MKSSFTNRVYNFFDRHSMKLESIITTKITYIKSYIQDVVIGKRCEFNGNIKFLVGNGGSIVIGDDCKFISYETGNSIGINHKCILSATPGIHETCKLVIGDNCGFSGTAIWCFENILIGNNVRCGANTLIMDGDAHFEDTRTLPPKPIVIEDNVFLGTNVVVKKGVKIGKNTVIGMNSVVTKSIPANSVAVGNPCKVIHSI